MNARNILLGLIAGSAVAAIAAPASAQQELTVYCGVQEEWCRPMVQLNPTVCLLKARRSNANRRERISLNSSSVTVTDWAALSKPVSRWLLVPTFTIASLARHEVKLR